MKTLMYFFVMAVILIAGCAKDDTLIAPQDSLELKKAKVPIPFNADCIAVPDMESNLIPVIIGDYTGWVHSRLIVSGTGTLLGKIDATKSYYDLESLVFFIDEVDGLPYTLNRGKGKVVAANGDSMEFTFWAKQSFDENNSYTGKVDYTPGSGTGKFKGCSGSSDMIGGDDYASGGTWFKLQGYLVYE